MTNQPPLNPDAVEHTIKEVYGDGPRMDWPSDMTGYQTHRDYARSIVEQVVSAYLAVALPDAIRELTEAIRLTVEYVGTGTLPAIPGWSWYDAMVKYAPNDAEVLRAMNPLPEPAAALPEVTSVESIPAKMRMLMWEGGEVEVGEIPDGYVLVGFEMETDRAWSMADKVTINIERPEVNDA